MGYIQSHYFLKILFDEKKPGLKSSQSMMRMYSFYVFNFTYRYFLDLFFTLLIFRTCSSSIESYFLFESRFVFTNSPLCR